MRKGITLLESLFAIFVAAIGILSLAALIPVGKDQITKAENSDRGSSIAQSALNAVENMQFTAFATLPDAVVIDPWFLSRQTTATLFPYDAANYLGAGTAPRLPRLTPYPSLVGTPVHRAMANRVFFSHDDLTVQELTRPEDRRQMMDNMMTAAPFQGDYSWLAVITPALSQRLQPVKTMFTVSVAVFHKRATLLPAAAEVPAERIVLCDLIGSGAGGGDVRLRLPVAGSTDKWLKVKPNQWIMLAGAEFSPGPSLTLTAGTGQNRGVVGWYRVVAAGDVTTEGTERARYATLAGRDWLLPTPPIDFDSDGDGAADSLYDADNDPATGARTLHAYLLDDCIAVAESTVRYDPTGY